MIDVQGSIRLECKCGAATDLVIPTGWEIGIMEVEWPTCPACTAGPGVDERRCGAGESQFYDHKCVLPTGHTGWHQDWRDGRLYAEWRETWTPPPHRLDENPATYAQRLLGLWADDDRHAARAWQEMLTWVIPGEHSPDATVDDVRRALIETREDG